MDKMNNEHKLKFKMEKLLFSIFKKLVGRILSNERGLRSHVPSFSLGLQWPATVDELVVC